MHSYSIFKSSFDRPASIDRRDLAEQGIGPIGGTSSSFSFSDSTSGFADEDERVRLDEPMNSKVESRPPATTWKVLTKLTLSMMTGLWRMLGPHIPNIEQLPPLGY